MIFSEFVKSILGTLYFVIADQLLIGLIIAAFKMLLKDKFADFTEKLEERIYPVINWITVAIGIVILMAFMLVCSVNQPMVVETLKWGNLHKSEFVLYAVIQLTVVVIALSAYRYGLKKQAKEILSRKKQKQKSDNSNCEFVKEIMNSYKEQKQHLYKEIERLDNLFSKGRISEKVYFEQKDKLRSSIDELSAKELDVCKNYHRD